MPMELSGNVAEWLADAPQSVVTATEYLLERVQAMRETETIYPPQGQILNALACTGPDDVRVVILGQDPYHGAGQAMGLAFSVPDGVKLPPSLRNIFKEIAADFDVPIPACGNLTAWAHQGVLLLNTSLTVRDGVAASHAKLGWRTLTDYVVETCFELPQPVVFLAWGKHAIALIEDARIAAGAPDNKFVLTSTHPSPLSAARAAGDVPAFIGSRPFVRANRILEEHGVTPIDWTCVG